MSLHLDFKTYHPHSGAGLRLKAESGTISVIHGASGRGKSTLLAQIWGSRPIATSGHVIIESDHQCCEVSGLKPAHLVQVRRKMMSYVEQKPAVLKRDFIHSWFELESLHLQDGLNAFDLDPTLLQRRASDVSGGELQRFVLLRAILSPAPILLLDEPFTGLDAERVTRVARFLQADVARGRMLVMTAHEPLAYADQAIQL